MRKNVWDISPDEIFLIDKKRYRWNRDFKKRYPLGILLTREIINIDDVDDKQWVLRGFEVEIENNKDNNR